MLEPPIPEEFAEQLFVDETEHELVRNHLRGDDTEMAALLDVLGKKHTLALLHQFSCDGTLRFNELEDALDIPPNTLSARLQTLTEMGFLDRQSYDEIPPRVEYRSTGKVRDLSPVLWYLGEWMERHGPEPLTSDSAPA